MLLIITYLSTDFCIVQDNYKCLHFEIKTPEPCFQEAITKNKEFSEIFIQNEGLLREIGKPELPAIRRYLMIPDGDFEITIGDVRYEEYELKTLGILNKIKPSQPSIPKIPDGDKLVKFEMDNTLYNSDIFYPEKIFSYSEGYIRNKKFILFEFYPVQYNPLRNRIRFYKDVQFNITFKNVRRYDERYTSPVFESFYKRVFVNYKDKGFPSIPIGYLIITPDIYLSYAESLKNWKEQKGYYVRIARTSEIGSDTASIKNYIQNAYDNWDIPPTFVCLLGDVDVIPTFPGKWGSDYSDYANATDLHYVRTSGTDIYPDIFIGRISIANTSQAQEYIRRVINYERFNYSNNSFTTRSLFIGSSDHSSMIEKTHRFCGENYHKKNGIQWDSVWARIYGSNSRVYISQYINQGVFWVNMSGHGSETGWGDPYYPNTDVQSLSNQDMYPFVVSNACLTGRFNYSSECFAETWIRQTNKGAIGFLGSSNYTYWDEDDIFEPRLYVAYFDSINYSVSSMENVAKTLLAQYFGETNNVKYYFEEYNIIGEPSIDLWVNTPDTFIVSHSGILPLGQNTYIVNVNTDTALVSLYANGTIYGVTYTQNGVGIINISSIPSNNIDLILTITKHNMKPYIDTVKVRKLNGKIEPESLEVNIPQMLKVSVLDTSSVPYPNVVVRIEGFGVNMIDTTDESGIAFFNITPPFGEELTITGEDYKNNTILFSQRLKVYGGEIGNNSISASVDTLNINGFLVTNFTGSIRAYSENENILLFIKGCGIDTSLSSENGEINANLLPLKKGKIFATICSEGYKVSNYEIDVREPEGKFSGYIIDSINNKVISDALIYLYKEDSTFITKTDSTGFFHFQSIPLGNSILKVIKFGYREEVESLFIKNEKQETLKILPLDSLKVSGYVNSINSECLDAKINIFYGRKSYKTYFSDTLSGYFEFFLPVYDSDYTIYFSKEGYIDTSITLNIQSPLEMKINLYPENIIFQNDFEKTNGDFTSTGSWSWGDPNYSGNFNGPTDAHSGIKCWGTNLTGDYPNSTNSRLTSPFILLPENSKIILSFYQWFSSEEYYDGGNVKVSTDGTNWAMIFPIFPEKYDTIIANTNPAIPYQKGFSGKSRGRWEKISFDISEYAGNNIYIRFLFGSDMNNRMPGWYIDDIKISSHSINVGMEEKTEKLDIIINLLKDKKFEIIFLLTEKSIIEIKLIDIAGRLINVMRFKGEKGRCKKIFEVEKEGIYFLRLKINGKIFIRKIVII